LAASCRAARPARGLVPCGRLATALVAFAVEHLRQSLYPILAGPSAAPSQEEVPLDTLGRVAAAPATPAPEGVEEEQAQAEAPKPAAAPPPSSEGKRPRTNQKDAL